jgi:hypothetical protein
MSVNKQKIAIVRMPGVSTRTIDEMWEYLKEKYDDTDYEIEITNKKLDEDYI